MTSDKIFIIQKAQQGERKAMQLIYEEYYQYVLDYSHRYLMNYNESKDVAQDIFLRVFDKLDSYKFESDFRAWLNIVCRNHIISYLRTEKKNRMESLTEFTPFDKHNEDDIDEDQLEQYRKNLSVDELFELLAQLDEKSRTIFNLYAIDKLTHREIGLQLGISEGTSKSQLSRARVKLKSLLAETFEKNKLMNKKLAITIAVSALISFFIKGTML